METRVQFSVDSETKKLAQEMALSEGRTLTDACRELTINLANKQREKMSYDSWLTQQIDLAFEKLNSGKAVFFDNDTAKDIMSKRKIEFRKNKDNK